MPPRKRAGERAQSPSEPFPSDKEIIDAIKRYRELSEAQQQLYHETMQAREHLVTVLRAAGVVGFSSL